MPENKCKDGKVPEGIKGRCIKPKTEKKCPEGKVPEGVKGRCIKPKTEKKCPEGKEMNQKTKRCNKIKTEKVKKARAPRKTRQEVAKKDYETAPALVPIFGDKSFENSMILEPPKPIILGEHGTVYGKVNSVAKKDYEPTAPAWEHRTVYEKVKSEPKHETPFFTPQGDFKTVADKIKKRPGSKRLSPKLLNELKKTRKLRMVGLPKTKSLKSIVGETKTLTKPRVKYYDSENRYEEVGPKRNAPLVKHPKLVYKKKNFLGYNNAQPKIVDTPKSFNGFF